MINAKDKKPADFFDIKRPAITDFVMKKTRAIKAEKAGKILNLSAKKTKTKPQNSYLGKFIFVASVLLIITASFVGFNAYQFRGSIIESLKTGLYDLKTVTENFRPLNSNLDREGILASNQELELDQTLNSFAAKFLPTLRNNLNTYSEFKDITLGIVFLFQESAALLNKSTDLIFNQEGEELISQIESIKKTITEIQGKNKTLAASAGSINGLSSSDLDFYLPFQVNLSRFENFLKAFLPWLKSAEEHHLLVVLENTAITRPAGGLIETYADVVLSGGKITSINIHGISEVDKKLNSKIVPPKPLQVITAPFEAADANWFFDFKESGSKILQLVEKSELYRDITFDGVISITPKVVSEIIKITGPIKLAGEEIEITSDNFTMEIQKEEERNYELKILQELTPLVFEKMGALDNTEKQIFIESLASWSKSRDLQVYFKDISFQNFFENYEVSGRPHPISQDFYGDYLALVNSNIDGGKTDLFIKQKLTLNSSIGENGVVNNNLEIERTHTGRDGKYQFYKVPNQIYVKIFTPKSSRLESAEGGIKKTINPFVNYAENGYLVDPLISQVESTRKEYLSYPEIESFREYDKNVFSTWLKTPAGKTDNLKINYTHQLSKSPKDGFKYQFVFENQPGIVGEYLFEISAPVGFIWKENNSPVFEYQGENISGKVFFELTLQKQ